MMTRFRVCVPGLLKRANVSYEASVQEILRNPLCEDPGIGGVGAPYPKLQMEWLPGLEGRPIRGGASREVFRMYTFRPSSAVFLLQGAATILEPTPVEELALAIRTKPPH